MGSALYAVAIAITVSTSAPFLLRLARVVRDTPSLRAIWSWVALFVALRTHSCQLVIVDTFAPRSGYRGLCECIISALCGAGVGGGPYDWVLSTGCRIYVREGSANVGV